MQPYEMLEQKLAEWCGYPTVVCNSGTAALHLALESLNLDPKTSIVVVPDYTMIACPRAATLAGLGVVLVDCDKSLLMDLDLLDEWLGWHRGDYKDVVVMAVHIYGRRVNMESLHIMARKYDLLIVEDLAEAHGVPPHSETDAACWSFYRNKIVHGEEGGAVAFPRKGPVDRAIRARQLRSLGFTDAHDFEHVPRGHNYRLANCLATLISNSLEELPNSLTSRRLRESWWDEVCPDAWKMPPRTIPWVYDVRIPGLDRDRQRRIVNVVNKMCVGARLGFWPISCQQEYQNCPYMGGMLADRMGLEVFYLPLTEDISVIRDTPSRVFKEIRRIVG